MSIEAKTTLLSEVERSLSASLTAADLSRVMRVLTDKLARYGVEQTAPGQDGTDDLLEAYLDALAVQGRSAKTIDRYRYIITRMTQALSLPTREITVYHLRRYLAEEKARGISDRTLEGSRQVYSAYFNWCQRERLIEINPTANLGAIKYQKKQRDVYSDGDMERMKFGCKSVRDRAIICFLRSTGCRISEMVGLDRDDVDLNRMECTVLGKGNKERTVYFDGATAITLKEYFEAREDLSPALFAGRGTLRIQPNGVRKMLKNLGERSMVTHVHPHKFRRTAATSLIRHGMPVQEVAAILGHEKLDTTMTYVAMDQTDIRNSYRKYA